MDVVTPVEEIHELLRKAGWKAKTRRKGNKWIATGTSPNGDTHKTDAHSEAMALGNLLTKAMNLNYIRSFASSVDPNVSYIYSSYVRVASKPKLAALPLRVARYVDMARDWPREGHAQQLAAVEDAARMVGLDINPQTALRHAHSDLASNGGRGHLFRAAFKADPATVGKMWLLLAPLSSQLSVREGSYGFYAQERAYSALRHEEGLDNVPLGLFTATLEHVPHEDALLRSSAAMKMAASTFERDEAARLVALLRERGAL